VVEEPESIPEHDREDVSEDEDSRRESDEWDIPPTTSGNSLGSSPLNVGRGMDIGRVRARDREGDPYDDDAEDEGEMFDEPLQTPLEDWRGEMRRW